MDNTNQGKSSLTAQQNTVINAFDKFIGTCIIGKKALLKIDDKNIDDEVFTEANIQACIKYLENVESLNPPKDGEDKSLKAKLDKEPINDINLSLLCHCYWIMYMMNDTSRNFMGHEVSSVNNEDILFLDKYLEIASTKQVYSKEPIRPFRCLLSLIKDLLINKLEEDIKQTIIDKVLLDGDNKEGGGKDDRIKNVLLFMCNPDAYICTISQGQKDAMLEAFKELQGLEQTDNNEEKLKEIEKIILNKKLKGYYDKKIQPLWDSPTINTSSESFSLETLLTYKKAIVLYGPPGTGKSFTARELAQRMIAMKVQQCQLENFIDNQDSIYDQPSEQQNSQPSEQQNEQLHKQQDEAIFPHIHRLQLHANYTYEDFICGKTIDKGNVENKKGWLMQLIQKIEDDRNNNKQYSDLPHIVILDEINRVDISRVFGELFTAMESDYRQEGVILPIVDENNQDKWKLKIPNDLYFIGTMNMIDFSLEQVDFALRRRFAWVESNFNKDGLEKILIEKCDTTDYDKIDGYVNDCKDINKKIYDHPELGEAYMIGHTFFAEIANIKKEANTDWQKAKNIIWQISIKPMIEAYCGSMNQNSKKSFVEDCKKVFLEKQESDKKRNNRK